MGPLRPWGAVGAHSLKWLRLGGAPLGLDARFCQRVREGSLSSVVTRARPPSIAAVRSLGCAESRTLSL